MSIPKERHYKVIKYGLEISNADGLRFWFFRFSRVVPPILVRFQTLSINGLTLRFSVQHIESAHNHCELGLFPSVICVS